MTIWRFLNTRVVDRVFVIFVILTTTVLVTLAIVLPAYF